MTFALQMQRISEFAGLDSNMQLLSCKLDPVCQVLSGTACRSSTPDRLVRLWWSLGAFHVFASQGPWLLIHKDRHTLVDVVPTPSMLQ